MTSARPLKPAWRSALAALLLWAFFAQAVTSMVVQSATVDEQAHFVRGYLYLKLGTPVFKIGHPILADALSAVPLWALTNLDIPVDPTAFSTNDWGNYSDYFVWRPGVNVDLVFFLSRLPIVALGMLFAALTFRWARQLAGRSAGLVALALFVFDPTIVAHSQLVTHDVPVSFFYFAATYCLWRYLETHRVRDLALTGIVFGLAQGSKFSALLLVPVFVIMAGVWPVLQRGVTKDYGRWVWKQAVSLLGIFAIGGLTLWALYHFEIHPWPGFSVPVPAAAYFDDMLWEVKYFAREQTFFLCGQ
jgi:dolichyl-phosphate-mannose--protein O-mannosyl transferase